MNMLDLLPARRNAAIHRMDESTHDVTMMTGVCARPTGKRPPVKVRYRLKNMYTHDDRTQSGVEWAAELGITGEHFLKRMREGKLGFQTSQKGVKEHESFGVTLRTADWAIREGISQNTIRSRITRGVPPKYAVRHRGVQEWHAAGCPK